MAKGWFRDLLIPMKPTESTPPTTTSRKSVISFRETFFIPLLLFDAMFPTTVPTLKKLVIYVKNRGEPLKRECMSESILSRDDAETPSLAFLAHISVHMGILLLLLFLPSPRHYIITSFDPPLFVLDGLLFSYYCLIGLSLHLSVQILSNFMKPMLEKLAISLTNKGIISVSSKFQSCKNREQKPLVDLACQSDLLVEGFLRESRARSAARSAEEKRKAHFLESLIGPLPRHNSDKTNAREASKGPCMMEGVRSLVDSTTRISSTDFDAPDNSAHLIRANQSGPIMLNSEKNYTSEGLIGEYLTESVLSLDDSTKRKSFPDFDAAENKAHLVRPYQSGPVVSLSENKNEGEALKKDLQQHCGGRSDAAAKSFHAIYDPGLHTTDSLTWKSFEVLETLRPREQQSNATDTDQERQIQTQMCDELSDAHGGRPDAAAKNFHAIYDPGFHTPDSVAQKSFEVLETLPARKQPNDGVPLLLPGRLTLEGCVQQEKSPDLPRVMQFNGVEKRVTKMPRYLGGLTAQSASSSCGPIGLPNGGHIVLLDELDQSTKNIEHVATADQCSPTLSLPEKKMVRKTLNRNCRTMSVIFEEKHQRFVRRCKGASKSLDAMCISRKHGINQVSMVEPIHKQRGIHQWPFLRSAVGLPDGGHILSLLERKIVRKTLKRKCRSMSVLNLEDHKQHVDRRWEDAAKSYGAKCIRRQLVIHRLSTAKRTHKKHGIHQWPFQRPAISLPDRGHILSLSEKKIVRKTSKRKCRSMSVLSLVDRQLHVDRRWEDAAKNIGAKRICRQIVIHRVSIAKRICRQHGIHHRWPFERDWATMKGYSLGDERPVEVIRLSTDGKLVSRRRRIYISWLGRFSPWRSALPGGLIVGPIALSSSEFAGTNNIAQRVGQDQRGSGSSGSENERTREQEDPKEINTNINSNNLRRLLGRMKRADAAKFLGVSVSTFKRACRACGINEWPRVEWKKGAERKKKKRKKDEWRPPDQHGENNPSLTCRTMATNGLTEMQNEMVGLELNEFFLNFVEGPNGWNTEIGSIAEMSSDWDVFDALEEESTPCQHPMPTIPDMMPHLSCSEPAPFQQPMPTIPDTMPPVHTMPHLACFEPALCQQPMPTIPSTMPTIHTMPHLAFSEPAPCQQPMPTIRSTMPTIHTMPHLACSEPAPCQQPMPTIPSTMPTIHPMPHLACSEPAPCQQPVPTIPVTMPHLAAREDMRFVTLKVTYGKEKILRFLFPLMSGIIELKEEVKKRLKLELDSFDIKYEDEEGDRIFLACDEDLRYHLQLFSNQIIRLLVIDSDSNTSNFH